MTGTLGATGDISSVMNQPPQSEQAPYCLVICASDSRGGAGLQAALTQAAMLGVACRTVITAVTVQSIDGVESVTPMSISVIRAQIQAALKEGLPGTLLVGWLPSGDGLLPALVEEIEALINRGCRLIWDPVIRPSLGSFESAQAVPVEVNSQAAQANDHAQDTKALSALIRLSYVMSPSLTEANYLLQLARTNDREGLPSVECAANTAARQLRELGAHTVLVSGGDSVSEYSPAMDDGTLWLTDQVASTVNPEQPETAVLPEFAMHQTRLQGSAHGTGSHLSAAIAMLLTRGERLYDALLLASVRARQCVQQREIAGVRMAPGDKADNLVMPDVGDKSTPDQGSSPNACASQPQGTHGLCQSSDWPLVTPPLGHERLDFPRLNRALGLYALTDQVAQVRALVLLGAQSIQWRVKQPGPEYVRDTAEALQVCRDAGVSFWINDDWQLALSVRPDGVHLGQEDVCKADLKALADAGIGIGISTHTYWEVARARALNPSYIAFGPVFSPLSKTLKYPTLGIERLREWVQGLPGHRFTCIGGIVPENAAAIAATGVGSLAVVTCIRPGPEQEKNCLALHQALENANTTPT